jgi:hypothetical protein
MADQNLALIYTLGVKPGIKRDGTTFESREFTDGVWTRFQRGVPKKMGGYRQMFRDPGGIPRGMIINAYNSLNYMFVGNQSTVDAFITGTTLGQGSGPYPATIKVGYSPFTIMFSNASSFSVLGNLVSKFPVGTKIVFSQTPGAQVYTVTAVTSNANVANQYLLSEAGDIIDAENSDNIVAVPANIYTTVTVSPAMPISAPSTAWIATSTFPIGSDRILWQFDMQYNPQGGALQVLAHPGLNLENIDNGNPTPVYAGNILPGPGNTWSFSALSDSYGTNPTYAPIEVDGGVCVLYPFIFVYGSNGFIANNHVEATYADQNFNDWNGPLANRVNMTAGKIVKGMPVRGGTNSPSGLFWATDSLIRVSFTGNPQQYWKYDIISSQTSILSSNAVVEMDGLYYWAGVDRFYLYNGSVQVLANDKNINWFYDNLNFEQRQKVWATKVPRYNEIWFFYPRGTATECTDAIIYNVKDKLWYDAGQADGARRSCGYTTEVFPTPIWCGWEYFATFGQPITIIATPGGEPAPGNDQFYLNGDATSNLPPGTNFQFNTNPQDDYYTVATAEYILAVNATLITATAAFVSPPAVGSAVYPVRNGYTIWQQEYSVNSQSDDGVLAIPASITTCDISWVGGDPSQDAPKGVNRRLHLRRIEPDFLQTGDMTLQILGKKFARGEQSNSTIFTFGPDDGKVDLRIENRESKIKFSSNTVNGNFEMGRVLITAEYGDERP